MPPNQRASRPGARPPSLGSCASERRKHPRVQKRLPLKVKVDSHTIVTETINISASGAYCEIDRYIAPMTRMGLVLLLPIRLKNNKTATRRLSCEGVLVRIEKSGASEGRFSAAIFFTRMKDADVKSINRYVESRLA